MISFITKYEPPKSEVTQWIDLAIGFGITQEELPLFLEYCASKKNNH